MIRTALVGLGNHMVSQIFPTLFKLPVQIAAVCDRDREKLERFRRFCPVQEEKCYLSYAEMIEKEKPEAVVCVGNAALHYSAAAVCLKHKIPVFVEKTPCESAAQAQELCRLEAESGCFAMAGFNRRFSTSYRMMKRLIHSEEFGKPCLYLAKYNSSEYPDDSYFVFNHVIHHLDLMRYLLGEIQEIEAVKMKFSERRVGYHISFISESGVMGFLQSSSLQCESYPMERVEITGDKSVAIADNVKGLIYNRFTANKTQAEPELVQKEDALSWNYNQGHSSMYSHYGYERELACFFDAVQGKREPENTFGEVKKTMELYERLLQNTRQLPD